MKGILDGIASLWLMGHVERKIPRFLRGEMVKTDRDFGFRNNFPKVGRNSLLSPCFDDPSGRDLSRHIFVALHK